MRFAVSQNKPVLISYVVMALTIICVGWVDMATPFLTVLFAYFALSKLNFFRVKWLAILFFFLLVGAVFYGFIFFIKEALVALPDIMSNAVPRVVDMADKHNFHLPFDDVDTLKAFLVETSRHQLGHLGNFAKIATKDSLFLLIGLVIAIALFLSSRLKLAPSPGAGSDNLYSLANEEIIQRFRNFYESFATVMGAQLVISLINTGLTAVFLLSIQLPRTAMVVGLTFLCGLLPIVGNVISNFVIVALALTISAKLGLLAIGFLVAMHKGEYFLNSKIIGQRIDNPIWLTLIAIIIGEILMGVPGMILAPVLLHYLKVETSQIKVEA